MQIIDVRAAYLNGPVKSLSPPAIGRSRSSHYTLVVHPLFLLGTIAILLAAVLESAPLWGVWSGVSIHKFSQLIDAIFLDGYLAREVGTIATLTDVLMLASVLLPLMIARSGIDSGIRIPPPRSCVRIRRDDRDRQRRAGPHCRNKGHGPDCSAFSHDHCLRKRAKSRFTRCESTPPPSGCWQGRGRNLSRCAVSL